MNTTIPYAINITNNQNLKSKLSKYPNTVSQNQLSYINHLQNNSDSYISFCGNERYTKNELKYIHLLKKINTKELKYNACQQAWGYNKWTNHLFDLSLLKIPRKKINRVKTLEKLKQLQQHGITDVKLQQSIKQLIEYYDNKIQNPSRELTPAEIKLKMTQDELIKKLLIHKVEIDGKEYNRADIKHKLITELDLQMRKKIYQSFKVGFGDENIDAFHNLIICRNEVAKEKGCENYFIYKLKNSYQTTEEELNILLDSIENLTEETYEKIAKKIIKKLQMI